MPFNPDKFEWLWTLQNHLTADDSGFVGLDTKCVTCLLILPVDCRKASLAGAGSGRAVSICMAARLARRLDPILLCQHSVSCRANLLATKPSCYKSIRMERGGGHEYIRQR